MENPNFMLWLAWAGFGSFLGWLVWKRYVPAVFQPVRVPKETPKAPAVWLFCEDGPALDRKVQWFAARPGGRTVIGSLPRAATSDTTYVYLTADDIAQDHAVISFNPDSGRYQVETMDGALVMHNNEPLPPGEKAELTDGDTLDLGRISRFRFTLTGPESS